LQRARSSRRSHGTGRRAASESIRERNAHIDVAGLQRGTCFDVTWRDIVEPDNVGAIILAERRGFAANHRLDLLQARLDLLDQGRQVRHHQAVSVVPRLAPNATSPPPAAMRLSTTLYS
jgi:hypothetical protein